MKNHKICSEKLTSRGIHKPEHVQRIDRTAIQMTSDRKLELVMGRLTAEGAVQSIQTPGAGQYLGACSVNKKRCPKSFRITGTWLSLRQLERSPLASPSGLWSHRTARLVLLVGCESLQLE